MKPVVVIVLERPEQRALFNQCLRGTRYRLVYATDGEDGFDRVREVNPELVLAHVQAPRIDGMILCQLVVQELGGTVPVVLFGEPAQLDERARQRAAQVGARDLLTLDELPVRLVDTIERALSEPQGPPLSPPRSPDPSGPFSALRMNLPARQEEAPFDASAQLPIEEAGEDMPTNLTTAPEELRLALEAAASDAEATGSDHTPTPRQRDDILDEPMLPVSGLGPVRLIGSGGATGRTRGDDLIQELPREITPSSAEGLRARPAAAPAGSRQRKGLDESQLGKRLVRRVQQVHQLLEHLDYYQLLGVEPAATPAQLRTAYFELSLEFHPDRFFLLRSGDTKAKIYAIFRHVSEAYAVLSDERRRAVYDEQRELRGSISNSGALPPPPSPPPQRSVDVRAATLDPRLQTPELRLDGVTAHPGARRYVQLAQVALKQDELDEARFLLALAVGIEPGNVSIRRVLDGVAKRRALKTRRRYVEESSGVGVS
jgi:CheY-like chemotaxis protein